MSQERNRYRICLVTSQYPPTIGGLGHSAYRIAHMLAANGLGVHVVVLGKCQAPLPLDEAIETAEEGPVTVHRTQVLHPDWQTQREADGRSLSEPAVLTRYNREIFDILNHLHGRYQYDLLHAFFLYPAGYVATAVAGYHGIKSIVSIRGNDIGKYLFDPLRSGFVKSALRQADAITSVASSLLRLADSLAGPLCHKSQVILNAIDLEQAAPHYRPDLPLGDLVIGTAGLFRYKKGTVYLLKALARLKDEYSFSLLLAGDFFNAAERAIHMDYLQALDLMEQVVFTDRIKHGDMFAYLQLFDIFVLPSLFAEGCPLTLLEAMAVRRPIVASRSGAIPEIIEDGHSGLLVEPGSSEAIYRALVLLLENEPLRQQLAEGAYQRAQALAPAKELQAWMDVYNAVCS